MENDPPTLHSAPLDYATLDADGNPEFVPEAEAAIDRGDKPNAIARYFRKKHLARAYIAKSLRRRFSYDALTGRCVCCDKDTSMLVTLEWQFPAPRNWYSPAPSDTDLKARVQTSHSLCAACAIRWFSRLRWPAILIRIGRVLNWIAIGIFLLRLILRRWMPVDAWLSLSIAGACLAGWVLFCGLGVLLHRRARPAEFKSVLPRWCKVNNIVDYCDLHEVREHAHQERNDG